MEDRTALLVRIDALIQKLGRVKDAFGSRAVDESMRESVQVRVGSLVDRQLRRLKDLEAEAGSGTSADSWRELLAIRRACDALFKETLAFLGGILIRDVHLDEGTCSVADQLLAELERNTDIRWSRRTIPGEGASFDRVAEIIRVPYPEFEAWSLPSLAHEFGHFVARRLKGLEVLTADRDSEPFEDLVDDQEVRGTDEERFLHEHFSDVLATFAQGPAFLCLSVALRFDPSTAYLPAQRHPPAAERVHIMLGILERLQGVDPVGPLYDPVIQRVTELWRAALRGAGQPERLEERLSGERVQKLDERLDELYALHEEHLSGTRYDGWLRAQRLSGYLNDDASQAVPKLTDDDMLADVLNAAWWWRIQHNPTDWLAIRRADRVTRAMCDTIVGRR